MKKHRFSTTAVTLFIIIIGSLLIVPCIVTAEELQPAALLGQRMKPLDKVQPTWSQKLPADKRFLLVLDGAAVLDRETGLVWERSLDTSPKTWAEAISYCYDKTVGGRKGWRLPTVEELASLIDPTNSDPALPSGHPFQNAQPGGYWTSTIDANLTDRACVVSTGDGDVGSGGKDQVRGAWAVRGGQ